MTRITFEEMKATIKSAFLESRECLKRKLISAHRFILNRAGMVSTHMD